MKKTMKEFENLKHRVSESYHSKHPQNENAKLVNHNAVNEKSPHRNRCKSCYERY
jgi:hypothetical protein